MGKHPSYCCQRCGQNVGYLGKFVEFICYKIFRLKMFKHSCDENVLAMRELHELVYLERRRRFWQEWANNPKIKEITESHIPHPIPRYKIKQHKFIKNG